MKDTTTAWEDLELVVETYNILVEEHERWTVRLSEDFDLLVYKEVSNTWFNQRTVRYKENSPKFDGQTELSDYFLQTLKKEFGSLLYLKSGSRVRYSGSKTILNKLSIYLEAHESNNAKLKIGKKNYRIHDGLLSNNFFAKPSVEKAIQENDCVLEIEDRETKISLIRHKENSYILRIDEKQGSVFARLFGNAGALSQLISRWIIDEYSNSNIKRYTDNYVLNKFLGTDFVEHIPRILIIEDEPFGQIVYMFRTTLSNEERFIWRSMHLAEFNQIDKLEYLIESVDGVNVDDLFTINKNLQTNKWEINRRSMENIQEGTISDLGDSINNYLLENSDEFRGFQISVNLKTGGENGQIEKWMDSLDLVFNIEIT